MVEDQGDFEQPVVLQAGSEFDSRRWHIKSVIRNMLAFTAVLGAVAICSVALANWTIEQTPQFSRDPWAAIREMKTSPEKYRFFDLQAFMPENPEVGKCRYFDPEFWAKVVADSDNNLKLVLCPPQDHISLFGTLKEN